MLKIVLFIDKSLRTPYAIVFDKAISQTVPQYIFLGNDFAKKHDSVLISLIESSYPSCSIELIRIIN